jgi:plastocyanin
MKIDQRFAIRCCLLSLPLVVLANYAIAESKSSRYACSEPNPAQLCNTSNTCGSASTPCTVDVKRTANAASSTPSISNARSNALFCVNPGTTVTWKSTGKDIGFVVDVGPSSPFDTPGAIIGGTDRAVSVVAKKTGCYKYSAGACMSGATYGMCGTAKAELIITGGSN